MHTAGGFRSLGCRLRTPKSAIRFGYGERRVGGFDGREQTFGSLLREMGLPYFERGAERSALSSWLP